MLQSRRARAQEAAFGAALVIVPIIGFLAFGAYPLLEVIRLSFTQVNPLAGVEQFVGLANFRDLVNDTDILTVLVNTLFFVTTLSIGGTALALALAVLVNRRLRGISFFRAAIFVPALVTMAAWTIIWGFILQPQGLLDGIVQALGGSSIPWLRSHWLSLSVIVIVQLLKNVGLNMMILLAALQGVPREVVEAATVDGAGSWRVFRYVIVPEISPAILMVFMLMIVGSFKVFDSIYLLTEGGPGVNTTTLAYYVYYQAFVVNNIGYASAIAVLLFAFVLALTAITWQLRTRFVTYE